MRRIVLATCNEGKVREIKRVLDPLRISTTSVGEYGDVEPPDENGETFAENARSKATYYARETGLWCLADDSGLVVDALNGAPGVRSARYAANECHAGAARDEITRANNAKLLRALRSVPDEQRTARFVCRLALSDGKNVLIETSGTLEGLIASEPRGENGFGYDPIFYLPELDCTAAELDADRKNEISHRGKALRRFASLLEKLSDK